MNYADPEETMNSLIGSEIVDWGRDESMYHITLEDGRMLIFVGMGILLPEDHAVH